MRNAVQVQVATLHQENKYVRFTDTTSLGMERICVKYRRRACTLFSLGEILVKTPSKPPKAESTGNYDTEPPTCGLSSPGSRTDSSSFPYSASGIGAAGLRPCSEARDRRSMVDNKGIAHRPLVDQRFDRISAGVQRFKVAIVLKTPAKGLDERQDRIGRKRLYALQEVLAVPAAALF